MTDLSDANVLYKAFYRAINTAKWKSVCQKADYQHLDLIEEIQTEIRENKYRSKPLPAFQANERGRTRVICGNTIKDRTVRHALCDEVLMPNIRNELQYDNSASQKNKGVHFARRRLKYHLQKYYRVFGTNKGYALLIDFAKYYDNILHGEALRQLLDHAPDKQHKRIISEIIESFKVDVSWLSEEEAVKMLSEKFNAIEYQKIPKSMKTGERYMRKGIPIGDQTSQIIGIFYPHRIDNYCKIVKGLKFYRRYMDDICIIHPDKEYLKSILEDIKKIASELGMHINMKKTQIVRIDRPFHFLQDTFCLTETGHVIEKINKIRLRAMRRKIRKLAGMMKAGERTEETVDMVFRSWLGSHKKVMSRKQIENMMALYHETMGKEFVWKKKPIKLFLLTEQR